MKKKGFTLVELLVVIAIIALLMGILMPALARVRQIAYRLYCGTNLSGIGKAILIYAQDYDDEFPRAGLYNGGWVNSLGAGGFAAADPSTAYSGGASISSCFYLLIKFSEVTPKSFLCKGDSGVMEFDPTTHGVSNQMTLVDLYDFGAADTQQHCSYSYHSPFPQGGITFSLTASSDPGMAIAADPNPWQRTYESARKDFALYSPNYKRSKQDIQLGNSGTHQNDGQNVLFVDGHTNFEKDSRCGVDMDNIYTRHRVRAPGTPPANDDERQLGATPPTTATPPGSAFPMNKDDSFLVTDGTGVL